jgi:hypothetical protein
MMRARNKLTNQWNDFIFCHGFHLAFGLLAISHRKSFLPVALSHNLIFVPVVCVCVFFF